MVGILFFDPWFALRFLWAALFYAGLDSAPKRKRFGTPPRPQNIPSCHKGNKWIKYTPEVQHRPLKMVVGRCWKTTFLLGMWYFRGFVKLPRVLFRQSLATLQVGEGLCHCCFWFSAITTWMLKTQRKYIQIIHSGKLKIAGWKSDPDWRCISYWRLGILQQSLCLFTRRL